MSETTTQQAGTFELTPAWPGTFGNKSLRWCLSGFVGMTLLRLPFETQEQGEAHARERGWTYRVHGRRMAPCPACGEYRDSQRILPPWVPTGARCACCCV